MIFTPTSLRAMATLGVLLAGIWLGYQWHAGATARAQIEAQAAFEKDRQETQDLADQRAIHHAEQLHYLSEQLGAAHVQISKLTSRDCLDAGTVGMLNAIGTTMPATASEPADQAATTTGNPIHGFRFSTNQDLAEQIAVCRAAYVDVSGQVNAILDIEDARHLAVSKEPSN